MWRFLSFLNCVHHKNSQTMRERKWCFLWQRSWKLEPATHASTTTVDDFASEKLQKFLIFSYFSFTTRAPEFHNINRRVFIFPTLYYRQRDRRVFLDKPAILMSQMPCWLLVFRFSDDFQSLSWNLETYRVDRNWKKNIRKCVERNNWTFAECFSHRLRTNWLTIKIFREKLFREMNHVDVDAEGWFCKCRFRFPQSAGQPSPNVDSLTVAQQQFNH